MTEATTGAPTADQQRVFREKQTLGLRVAAGLAVLTVLEFIVAVAAEGGPVWLWLSPVLIAKAWLILDYYMHVRDLRGEH